MTLQEVARYINTDSTWRRPYNSHDTLSDLTATIRKAAFSGQVTTWGREHPDSEEFQLLPSVWGYEAEIRVRDNYAFFDRVGAPTFAIRLARGEVEAAWPKKAQA